MVGPLGDSLLAAGFIAGESGLTVFLQDCRVVNLVSKLQCSYQTAASAATPSSLFRTAWTILLTVVHCSAALLDASTPFVQLLVCVQFWITDFLQSVFLASQYYPSRLSFPFPVFHRFFRFLSSLLSRASFPSALLRSFVVFRRLDRLELAASADG